MDKLPNEILNSIFTDLHLLQKQECMLVCRRWFDVIRSTSLFSIVHINETRTINKIMDMLDKNLLYRLQTQTLVYRGPFPITISDRQLLEHFPLLRHIHMKNSFLQLQKNITKDDFLFSKFNNWRNQLEIIEQPMPAQVNNSLLLSGLFSGLQVLVLRSSYLYPSCSHLFVNTPNLKSLTIIGAYISTNDLEVLHSKLKVLESLTLEKALLTIEGTMLKPKPTTSLRAFSIDFLAVDSEATMGWFRYIVDKYPQLLHFRFVYSHEMDIIPQHEKSIALDVILFLVQNLGHRLKSLDISTPGRVGHIVKTLNTFDFNFEMLRLYALFSASRTSFEYIGEIGRYIRHLSITLDKFSRSNIKSFKHLALFKSLRIGLKKNDRNLEKALYLNDLFDLFPNSLESLELYDFIVDCRAIFSSRYHLKRLAIYTQTIPQFVCKFLSSCLPELCSFTIDLQKPTNNRMQLKGVGLKYLNISIYSKQYISIQTLNDNTTRYYPLRHYTFSTFDCSEAKGNHHLDIVKRTTSQNGNLALEFICDSVKDLIINNHLAL